MPLQRENSVVSETTYGEKVIWHNFLVCARRDSREKLTTGDLNMLISREFPGIFIGHEPLGKVRAFWPATTRRGDKTYWKYSCIRFRNKAARQQVAAERGETRNN